MRVAEGSARSGPPSAWSLRTVASLILMTVGLGLNLRASILLGPQLHDRFDVGPEKLVLLVGLPLLVAAFVRLPVGVLTDRYGARVTFPLVSLAAAASVFGPGLATRLPAVIVAGAAAGTAGAAFVVGAALLSRTVPYGRRGLALGVFSIGPAVAVMISALSRSVDPGGRRAALVLGGLLVVLAALASVVLRDHVPHGRGVSPVRRCVEMIRLVSTTSLTLLYVLALGGMVAIAVYLPIYLSTVVGLSWLRAVSVTGVAVGLAGLARLLGGWWTDRRPTAALLTFCYASGAALALLASAPLPRGWPTASVIVALAACDGMASGALLALIGKTAPADSVGAVMGITGAATALGALLPGLVWIGLNRVGLSHAVAWILLAVAMLAAALHVRAHGLRITLGLPVRFQPLPARTATTVAVVNQSDTRWGAAAVVTRLAELATSDELVVVYGSDEPERSRLNSNVLVGGLRDRLPRHEVVGLRAARYMGAQDRLATILDDFVDTGTIAVAITPVADLRRLAADLSSRLKADRVLVVSYTRAEGAGLHEVWNRGAAAPPYG